MTITSIAIFLVSAATIGLELALVRAFSIGHWHHFSFLVISTALLGFGAGGTCVTIASKALTANYKKTLWSCACGLALTVPIVFQLSQNVPLDELQLIWDPRQILYLCAYYLLFFVPFFCAGTFVALAFTVCADKAHRLYFYNMTGSGAGAAAIVAMMYGNAPQHLLLITTSVAFLAALLLAFSMRRRFLLTTFILAAVCIFAFSPPGPCEPEIEISENKYLVYYQALPDSDTLAVRYSPLGRLDCLRAPAVRHFPGLSITYEGSLPEQMLLITDADGISAINHFDQLSDLDCYDHTTSALPYHLLSQPYACIIGAGGGSDVAQALALGAQMVTAVEMNPQIIDLVRDDFADFASGLYERADVQLIAAEGRSFLQTTPQQFDIINISLLDSFTASAAGVYALNESHLYTVEAIDQALHRLRPHGILSITRILKTPPRDSIKMFATITETLRKRGVASPPGHIIMIRSWATATILVSPRPFSELQIASARSFARDRSFDLVYLPGIKSEDANLYHALEQPVYYESARRILSPEYETFYRNYAYNIRPATDDRPYFFDFFKFRSLPHMIRTMPRRWLPFSEWGYLVLVATLLQAVCASTLFILLPLWIARPIKAVRSRKLPALVYFLLLGLAYMFLEMGFIQKMTLLIGHPVFGVAVTLVGFLLFSGCGSAASARLSRLAKTPNGIIWLAVSAIVVIGLLEITLLAVSFDSLVGFSRPIRILLGLGLTAPLAFFMGMPFPTGLKLLHARPVRNSSNGGRDGHSKSEISNGARTTPLVPWAWGVNGFASVTGAVLGTFLAISLGFTTLAFIALASYLLAAIISKPMST